MKRNRYRMLLVFFAIPLMSMALVQCSGSPMSPRTDIPFPPSPTFSRFAINSSLSSTQLADKLEQLFKQHPVLRDSLPCYRYGPNKTGLSCRTIKREDVFNARFEPDKRSLIFSLDPRTSNVDYKPDYKYFSYLKGQIGEMLISHFGKDNVVADK